MTTKNAQTPETKTRLMETAVNLIRQSNYDNVGVAEICKNAGVTKGSFYHYFDSKADLFYEAAHYHWGTFKPQLDAVFSPENSAINQLNQLIESIIRKQTEHEYSETTPVLGCPFFVAGGQVGSGEDRVRQAAMELSEKAITYQVNLVQNLKNANLIQNPLPAEDLGRLLYQYVMGLLIYGRVTQDANIIRNDVRTGLYSLLQLAPEHWPES